MDLFNYNRMRRVFSDGWNSFWHFYFGILAYKFPIIIILFIAYQVLLGQGIYERNIEIDFIEFTIGYIVINFIAALN